MTHLLTRADATPAPLPEPEAASPATPRHGSAAAVPWVLAACAALLVLLDLDAPVLRPLAGLYLALGVPTWVLTRRLRWAVDTPVHALLLSLGASLLGLIVLGLALNTVLPWSGYDEPLARGPVSAAVVAVGVLALLWRPRTPLLQSSPRHVLEQVAALPWRLVPALSVLSVLVSVAGALRLNNGAGSTVAVLGHVLVAALLVVVVSTRRGGPWTDALAVYAVGLSLLLSTSLRGWDISGHDVQREFISFQLTADAGRWSMSDYPNAYHACLSVNILPTVLADVTGLSGPVVFKLVLQLLAATVPVVVLLLARAVLERRLALAAVGVFVGFPTFSTDMPYLIRQEMAFLFLALAFLVATQRGVPLLHRRVLVAVFGVAVVLSHYSTTYLMIATMLIGLVLLRGLERWRRHRAVDQAGDVRLRDEPLVLLHSGVLVAIVVATFVWVSPVTHSGGHLLDTADESVANLLDGKGGLGSSDLSYSLLPGQEISDAERLEQFTEDAVQARRDDTTGDYLVPLTASVTDPESVSMGHDPLTGLGSALDRLVPVTTANGLLRTGSAFLLQVLLLVGLAAVVLRRARGIAELPDQTRATMVGALGAVAMVVVVPGLSAEYGVLRALQQALVLLAPVVVIGALTVLGVVPVLRRHAERWVQVGVVGLVVVLTGVVSTVTGGYNGVLALSNSGPYHEIHYVTAPEVAGYRWLGEFAGGRIVQAEVISDKLAANRLTWNPSQVLVASDAFPASLRTGSAVFLGPDTLRNGYAAEFFGGSLVTYRYPVEKLERRLDVVFSTPGARIYWPGAVP